jgi:hypothetical protein
MKIRFSDIAVGALCLGLIVLASTWPVHANDKVARGKYLVTTSGCNDCHTPWKMGANGPGARHEPHALGTSGEDGAGARFATRCPSPLPPE